MSYQHQANGSPSSKGISHCFKNDEFVMFIRGIEKKIRYVYYKLIVFTEKYV